jgi:NADH dehydrogenase FAD-containing subunit
MTTERGGHFVTGVAERVYADINEILLKDGSSIRYDVVSFNVGSMIPPGRLNLSGERTFTVKPIERILEGRNAIEDLWRDRSSANPLELSVIGGGPAGVEMAGALWRLAKDKGIECSVSLLTGGSILALYPDRFRAKAYRSLSKRGIHIREGSRVVSVKEGHIQTEDGSDLRSDVSFVATGVMPSRLFKDSGIPVGGDGGLLVNNYLQGVEHPRLFGGGDCVTMQSQNLARVGVYAVRQNPVLLHNLSAALEGKPLERFDPGSPEFLLIINLGDGTGVLKKGQWIFNGRLAWWIKNFIDRRFMRKFQLSDELAEPLSGELEEEL